MAKQKIGRNDPCHCGSGKKYKRCHLALDERSHSEPSIPNPALQEFQRQLKEQAGLHANGYYLPHIQTEFKGKRFRAVGSTLHYRGPDETLHEFIIDLLGQTIGQTWFDEQAELAPVEHHFIYQCYLHFREWQRRNTIEGNREGARWTAIPDGWARYLVALAFDVYCLLHRAKLPKRLLHRMKSYDQYQGARYEIAIAAIFTRLGFTIEFLDGKTIKGRRCEFIARHKEKGIEIAVEAKSRHRPGVLHRRGQATEKALLKGDVQSLIDDALGQNPGNMPFMIFVDLNAPLTPNTPLAEKPWFKDVQQIVDGFGTSSVAHPDSFAGIFVTNFSYHYEAANTSTRGEYLSVVPLHSTHPLPDLSLVGLLQDGLNAYGSVPDLP